MASQPQRRAQNNLVKDCRKRIDDQVCPARRSDDRPDIPRVRFDDLNLAFPAEKMVRPLDIAVAAPDDMSLSFEESCQQRARAARSQDKYPHRLRNVSHPLR